MLECLCLLQYGLPLVSVVRKVTPQVGQPPREGVVAEVTEPCEEGRCLLQYGLVDVLRKVAPQVGQAIILDIEV